jgi:hypothetical protein
MVLVINLIKIKTEFSERKNGGSGYPAVLVNQIGAMTKTAVTVHSVPRPQFSPVTCYYGSMRVIRLQTSGPSL